MIIGVSGKARSGKNVFAEFLAAEIFRRTGEAYILMAYADELKKMVQREFDLSWGQLWGDEKETLDKRYIKPEKPYSCGVGKDGPLPDRYWTGREIMQSYGEFHRSIEWNFWVRKLFSIIEEKEYKNVIITDVRYPNEVDPVIERGGYHVRITRPVDNKIHRPTHASEISLDTPYKVDFGVTNAGTLDDLKKLAGDIASGLIQLEKFKKGD
jgi:hypothetical protein